MVEEERLAEQLKEYVYKDGSIQLLCEINQNGARHGEILEGVDISSSTLTYRLREGEELELIERQAVTRNQQAVTEYVLTDRGLQILYHILDVNGLGAYQMYRKARLDFEAKAEEIREWTVANSEQLMKKPHSITGPDFFDDFEDQTRDSDEHPSDEDT